MTDEIYTREELDGYIAYSKALWDMVVDAFDGGMHLDVESLHDNRDEKNKFVAEYVKAFENVLAPVKLQVYVGVLLSFDKWLYMDCPITGHKGRAMSEPVSFHDSNEGNP